MAEEDKEFTNMDPKFNLTLDILIKKYEYLTSHIINRIFTILALYITVISGAILLYIGESSASIKNGFLTLWSANLFLQIIIILIIFTTFFLAYICINWVLRRKSAENFVQKRLMVHDFLDSNTKLNKLYLAKINSEGWVVKIKQDEATGIFELIDILKQESPSNN